MVYGIEDLERPDPGRLQNMLLLDVDMASSYQSTEESSLDSNSVYSDRGAKGAAPPMIYSTSQSVAKVGSAASTPCPVVSTPSILHLPLARNSNHCTLRKHLARSFVKARQQHGDLIPTQEVVNAFIFQEEMDAETFNLDQWQTGIIRHHVYDCGLKAGDHAAMLRLYKHLGVDDDAFARHVKVKVWTG